MNVHLYVRLQWSMACTVKTAQRMESPIRSGSAFTDTWVVSRIVDLRG